MIKTKHRTRYIHEDLKIIPVIHYVTFIYYSAVVRTKYFYWPLRKKKERLF